MESGPDPTAATGTSRSLADSGDLWIPGKPMEILRQPLEHLRGRPVERVMAKTLLFFFQRHVIEISGLEHVSPECDPLILALNHNQKREALLVPTLLIHLRRGKLIHFFADWNYRLMPIVGSFLRRSGCITVVRKDARPRFLNVFKPLFRHPLSAFARARQRLEAGSAVGIFPEGRVNRDPHRLLAGHPGAARLSLESGVKIVPAGITFPERADGAGEIDERDRLAVQIGAPIHPPREHVGQRAPAPAVRSWHDRLMGEIARLSGKHWSPRPQGGV